MKTTQSQGSHACETFLLDAGISSHHEDVVEMVVGGGNTWTVAYVGGQTTRSASPIGQTSDPRPASMTESELEEQFAAFADEALEWAQYSAGAVSESWPDA